MATPPRFAICVSGDLRTLSGVAWSLHTHVIVPTVAGGAAGADTFFHVWSSGSAMDAAGEAAARAVPGVVDVVVERAELKTSLVRSVYGHAPPRIVAMASKQGSEDWDRFRSQWRKVSLAFRLAMEHAARQTLAKSDEQLASGRADAVTLRHEYM